MRRKNTETKKAEQEWKRKTELKQRLTEQREEARWKKRKDIHARELERGRRERDRTVPARGGNAHFLIS